MIKFNDFVAISAEDDRERLIEFVSFVEALLAELVRDGTDPQGRRLFFTPLVEPMREAWEVGRWQFEVIPGRISELASGTMEEHGLNAPQLTFKLSVVRHFSSLFNEQGKRWLRRLLDAINTLLKSILDAVGAGGAAGELKDAIRDSIDEKD